MLQKIETAGRRKTTFAECFTELKVTLILNEPGVGRYDFCVFLKNAGLDLSLGFAPYC